jgi:hypothetical protein
VDGDAAVRVDFNFKLFSGHRLFLFGFFYHRGHGGKQSRGILKRQNSWPAALFLLHFRSSVLLCVLRTSVVNNYYQLRTRIFTV